MDPFGTRIRNGLCTGHDVRGPHRDGPGNGTELKLLVLLHGLQSPPSGPPGCIDRGPCRDSWDGPCTRGPPSGGSPPTPPPPPPPTPTPTPPRPTPIIGPGPPGPGPDPGGGPGPGPWWHIGPPQFGMGHWPPGPPAPLFRPAPQYGSTAKFSALPEHCKRCGGGGDDCLEYILGGGSFYLRCYYYC